VNGVGQAANAADLAAAATKIGDGASPLTLVWTEALATGFATIAARNAALGWRMPYDRGGTADDGPDEFVTAWSSTR
jgi:hypothetical protein